MRISLSRLAAAFLVLVAIALPSRATTYSVDFTDQWWNSSESGWGINVTQQQEVLFVTMFVYGADSAPRWFVGPAVTAISPQISGFTRFTGTLYQTTGPWFGAPFNPAGVVPSPVGEISISFNSPATGTLTYTINGTSVTKEITRQSLRIPSLAGLYDGGLYSIASQCRNNGDNGSYYLVGATTVTHSSGSNVTFRIDTFNSTGQAVVCTFSGALIPQGKLASVSGGVYACTVAGAAATQGTFTMTALDAQVDGFHAGFSGSDQFCTYTGRFGATRDVVGN